MHEVEIRKGRILVAIWQPDCPLRLGLTLEPVPRKGGGVTCCDHS